MASVIPSVMLSVAVVLILSLILGGIVQYYTSVVNEPPLLPSYGSLYVMDVSNSTGTVKIVNRFGYPVKALFSIAINTARVRSDLNITPPSIIPFWVSIGPGEVTVDIFQQVRNHLGSVRPDYILWDESGFLVGNVFFPLQRGAGAPLPSTPPSGGGTTREYTLSGIGTSKDSSSLAFATKYFDGDQLTVNYNHNFQLGYRRSICGYSTPTVITTYRYGSTCVTSYSSRCGCRDWCCSRWVNNTCVEEYCCNAGCFSYRSDYSTSVSSDSSSYPCGLDGVNCYYWTPTSSTSTSGNIRSLSLRGLLNDPRDLAIDRRSFSLTSTSTSTAWEYILPQNQQSQCVYTYTEIEYWVSYSYSTECCSTCGGGSACATARYCSSYSAVRYTTQRHACQYALGSSWWCAGRSTFLVGEQTSNVLVVDVKQTDDRIAVRLNITAVYRYTRYYDPDLSDTHIRLSPTYLIELRTPPIRGYINIPYSEDLRSATAFITSSITSTSARITTGSGFVNNNPPLTYSTTSWSGSTSTTPVGYVAISPSGTVESSKTFYFTTTTTPLISVSISQTSDPYITVPMCSLPCNNFGCSCSDTITLNVVVDLIINIGVTVNTSPH